MTKLRKVEAATQNSVGIHAVTAEIAQVPRPKGERSDSKFEDKDDASHRALKYKRAARPYCKISNYCSSRCDRGEYYHNKTVAAVNIQSTSEPESKRSDSRGESEDNAPHHALKTNASALLGQAVKGPAVTAAAAATVVSITPTKQ